MTLPALALAVATTVPAVIASATAANASTPNPYQLTGGLPAGAKMLDVGLQLPQRVGADLARNLPERELRVVARGHEPLC